MATSANRIPHNRVRLPITRALQIGVLGGLLAALGNLVVYAVSESLFDMNLVVPTGPGGELVPLTILNVAVTSVIPGLVAGLLLYFLSRVSSEPLQIFGGIALSILLFSFTLPLGAPAIPFDVRAALAVMHVVAAGAITWMVWRYWNK